MYNEGATKTNLKENLLRLTYVAPSFTGCRRVGRSSCDCHCEHNNREHGWNDAQHHERNDLNKNRSLIIASSNWFKQKYKLFVSSNVSTQHLYELNILNAAEWIIGIKYNFYGLRDTNRFLGTFNGTFCLKPVGLYWTSCKVWEAEF